MCRKRLSICVCCFTSIKDLDIVTCSRSVCDRCFVYPKVISECDTCQLNCDTKRCNKLQILPRYWIEKDPEQRIVHFGLLNCQVVVTTNNGKKFYYSKK